MSGKSIPAQRYRPRKLLGGWLKTLFGLFITLPFGVRRRRKEKRQSISVHIRLLVLESKPDFVNGLPLRAILLSALRILFDGVVYVPKFATL